MKKFIKYSLLVFFFFLSAYFIFCSLTNYSYDRVLPPYVQTFIAIKEPKKIVKTNREIIEKFAPNIKQLMKFIPFIPNLQIVIAKLAEGPILILDASYYRGIVSLGFMLRNFFLKEQGIYLEENLELSKRDEDAFIIRNNKETLVFLTKKRNLIIISPSLKAIMAAKANLEMEDKEKIKVEPEGDIFSFFMPHDLLKSFISVYPQIEFMLPILKKVDYATMTFYFHEDCIESRLKILLKEPETYAEKVYAKLLSIEKKDVDFFSVIPAKTETFFSFSIESFQDLYRYLVIILKDYPELFKKFTMGTRLAKRLSDMDMEDLFFSWIGNNVTTLSLNGQTLFLVEVRDRDLFLKAFSNFIGEKETIDNIDVFKIELPGIIGILKSLFAPSIQLPVFSFYKGYIVISNEAAAILKFMSMDIDITSTKEYEVYRNRIKKGQIQFFVDIAYGNLPITSVSGVLKDILRYYQKFYGSVKLDYPKIEVNSVFIR